MGNSFIVCLNGFKLCSGLNLEVNYVYKVIFLGGCKVFLEFLLFYIVKVRMISLFDIGLFEDLWVGIEV